MARLEELSEQFFVFQERGYGAYLSADELLELCGLQYAEVERLWAIVDKLPKTTDGEPYIPYNDDRDFWAVWRYYSEDEAAWRVSRCRTPQDPDEISTGFAWIIEDAEDECELHGVYSTREAAEARKEE